MRNKCLILKCATPSKLKQYNVVQCEMVSQKAQFSGKGYRNTLIKSAKYVTTLRMLCTLIVQVSKLG